MGTLATLLVKIGADVSDFHTKIDSVATSAEKTGKQLRGIGGDLSAGLTAPLALAGGAALGFSHKLNASMADVETLIPGATERVQELKTAVQDMAVATGTSTQDLAGGLYQTISAFGDGADTIRVLDINARAAAAGLATTKEAIDLTSAVTKGYGDTSAAAVQHASDLAFTTVRLGQTTFPELAASIGRVTPLAAALGVTQAELFGVMATGTGVTGTASEVSTQLRGVLQSLMAPTDAMATLYSDLGFESGQAMLQQLGLQGTLTTIVGAATAAGVPLQSFIGSIEGQTLALALAGPQAAAFTEKLAAMQTAAGATDVAFQAQTQGVNASGFAWQQFQQHLAVTAQQVGDSLQPAFSGLLSVLTVVLGWVQQGVALFTSLPQPVQTTVLVVLALVAALGPLLVVIGVAMTTFAALAPLLPVVAAGFALITGPIGLVVLAIAAVIAGIVLLVANWETIRQQVPILGAAFDLVVGVIQTTIDTFLRLATAVVDTVSTVVATVQSGMTTAQTTIQSAHDAIHATISAVWQAIPADIRADLELISSTLQQRLADQVATVRAKTDEIQRDVQTKWDGVRATTATVWSTVSTTIGTKVGEALGMVRGWGADVLGVLRGLISSAGATAGSIGRAIIDGIMAAISAGASRIGNKLADIARGALSAAKSALGISSPSKRMQEEVGEPAVAGILKGLDVMRPLLDRAMSDLVAPRPVAAAVAAPLPAVRPARGHGGGEAMTVVVEVDGRELARATVPYLPGEIVRVAGAAG